MSFFTSHLFINHLKFEKKLINIRNYFKALPIVIILLGLAWFVSLQLTKQRVQLEAENRLNNLNQLITPYIWNFKWFKNDIVRSFQDDWEYLEADFQIKSPQARNPQLSLNFSGETINLVQHSELIITSKISMSGTLNLQAKINLSDGVYYYLENIKLSGKIQRIDLDQKWKGVSIKVNKPHNSTKIQRINKISSLVLIFKNPKQDLIIDTISLPYASQIIEDAYFNLTCDGQLYKGALPKQENRNIFTLTEGCLFPSNYMWLKHKIQNTYPGSILLLKDVKLWQQASFHKINKSYTNNYLINVLLYLFLMGLIAVIYLITKKYSHQQPVVEDSWYLWISKQLKPKNQSVVIRPYGLVLNYVVVLVPSAIFFLIMAYYKLPNIDDFKILPFYLLWALLQQLILGSLLAQRVFYNRTKNKLLSSLLAAAVFSLMHFPSTSLMLLTFIVGGFWAYSWLTFKRLLPLALSHSVLALMFYATTSDRFSYSAKVFQWFWE